MSELNMPPRDGFHHNGLIVYAAQYQLEYQLETAPPSWLIVWLDEHGESLRPRVRPARSKKRMAAVRPGDEILHKGDSHKVVGVSIYRALAQTPGREVATAIPVRR